MSLFNSDATVAKVVQYFNENSSPNINTRSRDYWTGIDMSVHSNQPFFKTWVAFCAISKMFNDNYYYSDSDTFLPKRTPIKFKYISNNLAEIIVSFAVEAQNISEVSNSGENGYLMSNMGSQYYSSSNKAYYTDTPYFDSSYPRANGPLQLIWDSAKVLNALARGSGGNKNLPNNGGLNIRISEGRDNTKLNVSIKSDLPLVSPLLAFYPIIKNTIW